VIRGFFWWEEEERRVNVWSWKEVYRHQLCNGGGTVGGRTN